MLAYLSAAGARRLLGTVLLAVAAMIGAPALAPAQPAVPAAPLDQLFAQLAQAQTPGEAERIEEAIWQAWSHSGSATVDFVMHRGSVALAARNYAAALDMFSVAIDLAPDYAEAWNKRATVYYLINDYEAAIADVTHVLAREPRHWAALMGLAVMFDDLDRKQPALEAYRAALKINPQLADARDAVDRLTIEVEGQGI